MATVNIRWTWTGVLFQDGTRWFIPYLLEDLSTDPVETTTGNLEVQPLMTVAELETSMESVSQTFADRNNWKTTINNEVNDPRTIAVEVPDPEA